MFMLVLMSKCQPALRGNIKLEPDPDWSHLEALFKFSYEHPRLLHMGDNSGVELHSM